MNILNIKMNIHLEVLGKDGKQKLANTNQIVLPFPSFLLFLLIELPDKMQDASWIIISDKKWIYF